MWVLLAALPAAGAGTSEYDHVTLSTSSGLRATLFLPPADASDPRSLERAFYRASRFDWSSQLGDFRLGEHTICDPGFWRAPHDPAWTEAAVGLAGEFGCGDDGSTCPPGWDGGGALVNGVLGYDEAGAGGAFLKIGVGALRKGSCAGCDPSAPADMYRFNSPYEFASPPQWTVTQLGPSAFALEHSAQLPGGRWAYSLRRTVELLDLPTAGGANSSATPAVGGRVRESWTLSNLGSEAWGSPYYSHNFFNADGTPTDERWSLQLDGLDTARYTDGAPSWAKPLAAYTDAASAEAGHSHGEGGLRWMRQVEEGAKLKANFAQPPTARPTGAFSMRCGALALRSEQCLALLPQGAAPASEGGSTGCGAAQAQQAEGRGQPQQPQPQPQQQPQPQLYAFNLYAEAATLSPEPLVTVRLAPGQSARWSRTLTLRLDADAAGPAAQPAAKAQQASPALLRAVRGASDESSDAMRAAADAAQASEEAGSDAPDETEEAAERRARMAPGLPLPSARGGSAAAHVGLASLAGLLASAAAALFIRLKNWRTRVAQDAPWPRAALVVSASSALLGDALGSPGGRSEAECELLSAQERIVGNGGQQQPRPSAQPSGAGSATPLAAYASI